MGLQIFFWSQNPFLLLARFSSRCFGVHSPVPAEWRGHTNVCVPCYVWSPCREMSMLLGWQVFLKMCQTFLHPVLWSAYCSSNSLAFWVKTLICIHFLKSYLAFLLKMLEISMAWLGNYLELWSKCCSAPLRGEAALCSVQLNNDLILQNLSDTSRTLRTRRW